MHEPSDENISSKEISANSENARLALSLAAVGLPVFPCLPKPQGSKKAKAPYTINGFKDATVSSEQIVSWWKKWPDALVGLPTGTSTGIAVLDGDIDRQTGETLGESQISELGLDDPAAVKVRTASGGVHYIFAHVEGAKSTAQQVAGYVDTRGDGGYVIAPGSILPDGSKYAFEGRSLVEAIRAGDLPKFPLVQVNAAIERSKTVSKSATPDAVGDDPFGCLHAENGPTLATAVETLEATKQALATANNSLNRADWLKLALSLKAGFGEQLRDDFIAFSCRYAKGDCTADVALQAWQSAKKPREVSGIAPALALLKAEIGSEKWKEIWRGVLGAREKITAPKNSANHRKSNEFRLIRVGELEFREPEYLLAPMIEADALTLIFGEPGCGKSFLALDLAARVALGVLNDDA